MKLVILHVIQINQIQHLHAVSVKTKEKYSNSKHNHNIIKSKSYLAHISTSKILKALNTFLQKDRLLKLSILRLNYVAPYMGLQGASAHSAAAPRNIYLNHRHSRT